MTFAEGVGLVLPAPVNAQRMRPHKPGGCWRGGPYKWEGGGGGTTVHTMSYRSIEYVSFSLWFQIIVYITK